METANVNGEAVVKATYHVYEISIILICYFETYVVRRTAWSTIAVWRELKQNGNQ